MSYKDQANKDFIDARIDVLNRITYILRELAGRSLVNRLTGYQESLENTASRCNGFGTSMNKTGQSRRAPRTLSSVPADDWETHYLEHPLAGEAFEDRLGYLAYVALLIGEGDKLLPIEWQRYTRLAEALGFEEAEAREQFIERDEMSQDAIDALGSMIRNKQWVWIHVLDVLLISRDVGNQLQERCFCCGSNDEKMVEIVGYLVDARRSRDIEWMARLRQKLPTENAFEEAVKVMWWLIDANTVTLRVAISGLDIYSKDFIEGAPNGWDFGGDPEESTHLSWLKVPSFTRYGYRKSDSRLLMRLRERLLSPGDWLVGDDALAEGSAVVEIKWSDAQKKRKTRHPTNHNGTISLSSEAILLEWLAEPGDDLSPQTGLARVWVSDPTNPPTLTFNILKARRTKKA